MTLQVESSLRSVKLDLTYPFSDFFSRGDRILHAFGALALGCVVVLLQFVKLLHNDLFVSLVVSSTKVETLIKILALSRG